MTPHSLDQPIPKSCTVSDVLRVLQISRRTFDRLMAAHQLPLVETERIGRQRRFTGQSVALLVNVGRWDRAGRRRAS